MLQLINHDKESNAFFVKHYPFNYGIFGCAKFWVETNPSYGQRLVRKSAGPKDPMSQLTWNKPKASGFFDIVLMQLEDNPDSQQFGSLSFIEFDFANKSIEEMQAFSEYYYFSVLQQEIISAKLRSYKSPYRTNWKYQVPNKCTGLDLNLIGVSQTNNYSAQVPMPSVMPPHEAIPGSLILHPAVGYEPQNEQQQNTVVIDPEQDAKIAAAQLIIDTWQPWSSWARINADPVGAAAHRKIREDAEAVLGIVESKPVPLSIDELKRNG